MKHTKLMLVLLFLMTSTVMAQEPTVTPLISKELKDIPGREVLMITVDIRPVARIPSIDTMLMRSFTCWRAQ